MDDIKFYSKLDKDGFLSGIYWNGEEPLCITHLNISQEAGLGGRVKFDLLVTSDKLVKSPEEMRKIVSGLVYYNATIDSSLGMVVSFELDFLDQSVRTDKTVYLMAGTTETFDSLGKIES